MNANGERQIALRCTVRGCAEPLAEAGRALRCASGHAYDRAASGYVNLLQPQDRRSARPGDARSAAIARRRLLARGLDEPLLAVLAKTVAALPGEGPAVLDVGCGEGSVLARLAAGRPLEAHGLDLSAPSLDLAARLLPTATWVVANADRGLPYGDGGFDLALSLTSRRPAAELRRVLRPEGLLLVAVPGPDDLAELRAALQGQAVARDRLEGVEEELAAAFALGRRTRLVWQRELDRTALADLLAASYRGARASESERFAALDALTVTMSRDLGWFAPLAASGTGAELPV